MEARLVQIQDGRRLGKTAIDSAEFVIGRDDGLDLSLHGAARVSRRHARIARLGDRHTLTDLGSSNGTRLNGRSVRETVYLEPGDVIELGDEVSFVYEEDDGGGGGLPIVPILIAALLIVAAGVGVAFWLTRSGPDLPEEAVRLAAEGAREARSGNPEVAKNKLDAAAGLLFSHGYLDDVGRADVKRVAFERLGNALDGTDLFDIYRSVHETTRKPERREETKRTICPLDQMPPRELRSCLREDIELVLIGLRQDTSFPDSFVDQVGARLVVENDFLRDALARGRPLIPMLRRELEAANMPPLLHYLALIESGYKSVAVSPARAAGLWQFMPATGKQYGLKVGGGRDDRIDNVKSTRAAAHYLRDLTFEFGGKDLLLSLASYNRGENGVRRALKRLDDPFSDRSYWRLVEQGLLPEETAKYVPRFIAAAVAGEGGLPDVAVLHAAGY
jgi:hypothetical protein